MSIVCVGNIKGGVGKTTLAVNLAIAFSLEGRDVLLVDGDEQGTAMAFTQLRSQRAGGAGYTAVALHGKNIRDQTRRLASKYSDIVIDVGGRDTGSLRSALTVAQSIVIPVQPRSFDVWGVGQTSAVVREARDFNEGLRALVVLNGADSQGRDNDDAAGFIKTLEGVEMMPQVIVRRKAFPNAATSGLSVLEFDDPKAKVEFTRLVDFLIAIR